ncbi:MAG: imidazoleglycerol-phosphate dehydratase HisB [Desulfatirhabdiaceae bacterium]
MKRIADIERKTSETHIHIHLNMDGNGTRTISTGIPFFDHMLSLFAAHGFFDLDVNARGDIDIDYHHTVEDVGLCLGDAFDKALGDRKGIKRYGHAVVPMDETLAAVTIDLSKRPFCQINTPEKLEYTGPFNISLTKEFLRALATRCGMNLHVNVFYGENDHHVMEAIFKALGRSLDDASTRDLRIAGILSTKGSL